LWECQSGLLLYRATEIKPGGEFSGAGTICGTMPVEVKVKMQKAVIFSG
jgi:hypothetical protein